VALIRRRRGRQVYWSFPGGGVKRDDTPRRAARREVAEELGLDVRPERLLAVASGHALFLATIDDEPPLRMQGPEVARRSRRDRYRPEWVSLDELAELDVRPRTARLALVPLTATTLHAATLPDGPAPGPVPPEPAEAPDRQVSEEAVGAALVRQEVAVGEGVTVDRVTVDRGTEEGATGRWVGTWRRVRRWRRVGHSRDH
jgi:8-oxo-dGTP diphosphatase